MKDYSRKEPKQGAIHVQDILSSQDTYHTSHNAQHIKTKHKALTSCMVAGAIGATLVFTQSSVVLAEESGDTNSAIVASSEENGNASSEATNSETSTSEVSNPEADSSEVSESGAEANSEAAISDNAPTDESTDSLAGSTTGESAEEGTETSAGDAEEGSPDSSTEEASDDADLVSVATENIAVDGNYRDSTSTNRVNTQFVALLNQTTLKFKTLAQFYVTPYDLYGGYYYLHLPAVLQQYVASVESPTAALGSVTWTYDEEKQAWCIPLMALQGGLFAQTWIGSNPNYVGTTITLTKDWDEIKDELAAHAGESIPVEFYARFSNGDLISDIMNVTSIPTGNDIVLQTITGAGGTTLSDNFLQNSMMEIDAESFDLETNTLTLTNYFHLSPFVTYNTALGNKPYQYIFSVSQGIAPYIESITIARMGVPGAAVTFDSSTPEMKNFASTGQLVVNIFNSDQEGLSTPRNMWWKDLTGAYPLPMTITVKFKDDSELDEVIQQGVDQGSDNNRNIYFTSYMYSYATGAQNGMVNNSRSSSYYSFKDSDGDGLTDYYELYHTYTDPNSNDTDGDGRSDYQEVMEDSTDPNVAPVEVEDVARTQETLSLTTEPNRTVILKQNGVEVARTTSDSDGNFSFSIKSLAEKETITPSEEPDLTIEVLTESAVYTDSFKTQSYSNPEVSEAFSLLNNQTVAISEENITFRTNNENPETPPTLGKSPSHPTQFYFDITVDDVPKQTSVYIEAYNEAGEKIGEVEGKNSRLLLSGSVNLRLDITDAVKSGTVGATENISFRVRYGTEAFSEPTVVSIRTKLDDVTSLYYDSSYYSGNTLKSLTVNTSYTAPDNNTPDKIKVIVMNADSKKDSGGNPLHTFDASEWAWSWDTQTLDVPSTTYYDTYDFVRHAWSINDNGSTGKRSFGVMDAKAGDILLVYLIDTITGVVSDPTVVEVEANVDPENITSIEIATPPTKTLYDPLNNPDDPTESTLDIDGLTVQITDSSGNSRVITPEEFDAYHISVSSPDLTSEGEKTLTVSYKASGDEDEEEADSEGDLEGTSEGSAETPAESSSISDSTTLWVLPHVFKSDSIAKIELVSSANTTEYNEGESFDPTGIVVRLTDSDGYTIDVDGANLSSYGIYADSEYFDENLDAYLPLSGAGSKTVSFTVKDHPEITGFGVAITVKEQPETTDPTSETEVTDPDSNTNTTDPDTDTTSPTNPDTVDPDTDNSGGAGSDGEGSLEGESGGDGETGGDGESETNIEVETGGGEGEETDAGEPETGEGAAGEGVAGETEGSDSSAGGELEGSDGSEAGDAEGSGDAEAGGTSETDATETVGPDTTAPETPEVTAPQAGDTTLVVKPVDPKDGDTIHITITDKDGNKTEVEVAVTTEEDGSQEVELGTTLKPGDTVEVTITDSAGNTSEADTQTVGEAPKPASPSAIADLEEGDTQVVVTPPAEAAQGDKIKLVINGGDPIYVEVDPDNPTAPVTITVPELKEGDTVVASFVNSKTTGESDPITQTVGPDTTAPETPEVTAPQAGDATTSDGTGDSTDKAAPTSDADSLPNTGDTTVIASIPLVGGILATAFAGVAGFIARRKEQKDK